MPSAGAPVGALGLLLAEVERSLEIWSSKPVTGAWCWMSNTQVWFRPRAYWPAHTRVRFEAHLKGVQGARGIYGDANLTQRFRIGSSLVARASAATHHMKVWWNGHWKGNWPIRKRRAGGRRRREGRDAGRRGRDPGRPGVRPPGGGQRAAGRVTTAA